MLRDFRKNQSFNRRTMMLAGGQTSLTAILIAKLSYLQLIKYDEYSTRSDSNRIKPLISPAARGMILDRNGVALVKNNKNYRLLLYLKNRKEIKEILEKIAVILNLDKASQDILEKRISNSRRKSIISLIDNLSWDDLARIETNSHKLPGVSIESGMIRGYPYPYETANFLGYVSLPSEKEINEGDDEGLFMHPDFRIGKSGIEKSFDEYLRGKFGVKYVEVNAFGIPIRTLSTKAGSEGSKLNLTVDFRLQKFTSDLVSDKTASVVVMNVKTGEIISMVSRPSFNSNNFVEGISKEYWQELNSDKRKPLNNKPINAIYPPGSTFKLMVALAALEKGINPKNHVFCSGSFQLGRRSFHCWKEGGHGSLDMSGAIKNSCNVFFFTIANMIGVDPMGEMARRFGYGEYFDISLYGVKSGNVPSDAWKRKTFHGQPWTGGDTLNTAIGQGFVLATPLQLAVMASRIANGGVPIKPYLVKNKNINSQYDNLKDKKLTSANYLNLVVEGMTRVVNEPGGTAYGKRIDIKGFEMAGKTGTSQVISKREKQMSNEEASNHQNHAIFIGFAPISDPKYAVSVVVEHGGAGSAAAAPIGKEVLLEIQKLDKGIA